MAEQYAYLTGGASGIGKAVAEMLVKNNIKVFIADRDSDGAQNLADELNKNNNGAVASSAHVDVANWNSQAKAFSQAVADFGRIDYVYPIAGVGERPWLVNDPSQSGFSMPDLSVLDIDLTGVLYTVSLAIQQFRKQKQGEHGFRGKIVTVASICGIYAVPTVPVYTAAKHGIVGFTRSYGAHLPTEKITLNAVCPNIVRTGISTEAFYDLAEKQNLLAPIEGVVETFEKLLGPNPTSGECFEIGPNYKKTGAAPRKQPEYLDPETETSCDLIYQRSLKLHQPR
ncbi:glucose 1-dehydrogenase [Exophiala viscosa]|uniref:Glucose 1-dehydrogenase n=1 Tax=Exophiala viscosa TaxID=2486360 RepID=A0AAN6E529_9EURO|nr:glucose 1-dehydrogenase [Exophiala viscosa]KAI1627379.1 glucose 1-dehydrogenase [Exophiala viscosa]